MFGKFFASTFTGSMFGSGCDIFAVWGYVIAHTVEGAVELNPALLAAILGATPERIAAAIEQLCQPDPQSRNPELNGRRLVREGQFQYRVTSHHIYRAVKNSEDIRLHNRDRQRKHRAKITGVSRPASHVTSHSNDVMSQSVTRERKKGIQRKKENYTEAEAEAEAEKRDPTDLLSSKQQANNYLSSADADFARFQEAYPVSRRVGGKLAKAAFRTATKGRDATHFAVMLAALVQHKRSEQWQTPKLIPLMTTWLNQERWNQTLPELSPFGVTSKTTSNAAALKHFTQGKSR